MGAFYTSVLLKGIERENVISWLKEKKREAAVYPETNGCIPVFDAAFEGQEMSEINGFCEDVSKNLGCIAWAVTNHDDDLLHYRLYMGGKPADEYYSVPPEVLFGMDDHAEFEEDEPVELSFTPKGGDAALLCDILGNPGNPGEVESILRDLGGMGGQFIMATDRHYALLEALGITPDGLCSGYREVALGYLPPNISKGDLALIEAP